MISDAELIGSINSCKFDALDYGCSKGGSIDFIRKQLDINRIVGIDIDERKVELARESGAVALVADASSLRLNDNIVSACFMFHFLEHLPSLNIAKDVIRQACRVARDYVLIRQPHFGADEMLFMSGLKLAWSTWRGHSNKMSTLDFYGILMDLKNEGAVNDFYISYAIPIESTSDEQILPVSCSNETLGMDELAENNKPEIALDNVYREVCVIAVKNDSVDVQRLGDVSRVSRTVFPFQMNSF